MGHLSTAFVRFAIIFGILTALIAPNVSIAQTDIATTYSLEDVGKITGLGNSDLRQTTLNVIQLVLGLMTLAATALIIYGGFVWLTAAGNEDSVEKAKRIISAAVIGLVIIILAWAIVIFVARTTANVTKSRI